MTSHYDNLAQLDMYIIKRSLVPCKLVYGFPVTFERAAKIGPRKVRGYSTTDPANGVLLRPCSWSSRGDMSDNILRTRGKCQWEDFPQRGDYTMT